MRRSSKSIFIENSDSLQWYEPLSPMDKWYYLSITGYKWTGAPGVGAWKLINPSEYMDNGCFVRIVGLTMNERHTTKVK